MKRALPVVLAAVIVAVLGGLMLTLAKSSPAPMPTLAPTPVAVLKPELRVYDAAGVPIPAGSLTVASGAPFDLRISIEANAYIYLFDDLQTQTTLVWKHAEAEPWEKGEYSAEAPAFEGTGEHQLLVVASPSPIAAIDTWKVIGPEAIHSLCTQCEIATYSFYVRGFADAGAR